MNTNDRTIIDIVDRAITKRVHASEATHPVIAVKLVAAEVAANVPTGEEAALLNLICKRSIYRGYVLAFGDQP